MEKLRNCAWCVYSTSKRKLYRHLKLVEIFEDFIKRLPDVIYDVYEW